VLCAGAEQGTCVSWLSLMPSEKKSPLTEQNEKYLSGAWEVNTEKNGVLWHTSLAEFCLL